MPLSQSDGKRTLTEVERGFFLMLLEGRLFCRLSDVQSCKVELYGTHRAENCCYQRYKILLPWVPGGEAGEVGGARATRQQPAVCSFHRKRLNRRWLVKFEQRTGK